MAGFGSQVLDFGTSIDISRDREDYLNGKGMYNHGDPCPEVEYRNGHPDRTQFQEACGWHCAEWEAGESDFVQDVH